MEICFKYFILATESADFLLTSFWMRLPEVEVKVIMVCLPTRSQGCHVKSSFAANYSGSHINKLGYYSVITWQHHTVEVHVTNCVVLHETSYSLVIPHALNIETLLMSCGSLILWTACVLTVTLQCRAMFLVMVCGKAVFFTRTLCVFAHIMIHRALQHI